MNAPISIVVALGAEATAALSAFNHLIRLRGDERHANDGQTVEKHA